VYAGLHVVVGEWEFQAFSCDIVKLAAAFQMLHDVALFTSACHAVRTGMSTGIAMQYMFILNVIMLLILGGCKRCGFARISANDGCLARLKLLTASGCHYPSLTSK
jgi:uncharacterized sodium:solute symporter family permease YidK